MFLTIHRDTSYQGIPLFADESPQEVPDGVGAALIATGKASAADAPAPKSTPLDLPEPVKAPSIDKPKRKYKK